MIKRNLETTCRVEQLCIEDYEAHVGKILRADFIMGYKGGDCVELHCDPPARIRVRKMRAQDMINWTCNDYCDPNWDVTIVEPHPALAECSSLWVDSISRSIDGEIQHPSGWILDENQESPTFLEIQEPEPPKLQPEYTHTVKALCPHCCKNVEITMAISINTKD